MQRRQRRKAGALLITAALTVFVLSRGLSAQVPGPQVPSHGVVAPGQTALHPDEILPRLLRRPDGEVLRMWEVSSDLRTGGGGILLALGSPGDTWKKLLELLPREPGVSALDADLAFGSVKDVALVYQWRRHAPRTKQVRLARSDDGGSTWSLSSTPVDKSGKAFTPKVAWGRERSLVVVWADERRHDKVWDIYARRSADGGVTWESEQLLSKFPKATLEDLSFRPEIMSDGQDRFWAVWVGLRDGRSRLYLSRSVDRGQTWADPVPLSGESESVFAQRLARQGERLLMVWQDARTGTDRIYAVTSDDGGVTWTPPTRVDHIPADLKVYADSPSMVFAPNGEAFVTWHDARNGRDDVFFARSPDGGRTWGTEDIRLDMDEPGTALSKYAKIARADDGRLAVVWEDDREGHEGIYLRIRGIGQSPTWGPEIVVVPSGTKVAARTPSVVWGPGGALYVTWNAWEFPVGQSSAVRKVEDRILFPDK